MIAVELDVKSTLITTKFLSKSMQTAIGDAVERIGRKLERDAKQYAPVITGNLRRQIDFKRDGMTGEVRAKANYSAFVHGYPYHDGGMRKTTPFFTMARDNNARYAEKELDDVLEKVVTSTP